MGVLLFQGFELLDVFGPVEMLGMYPEKFEIRMVAQQGAQVASAQGPRSVVDDTFAAQIQYDILLVPGGEGTRREINNELLLEWIRNQAKRAHFVTSVCTGSAVLAKTGLLDARHATSNKMNFDWVCAQGPNVHWEKRARWVVDGNIFTSSGVSAGMDMTLNMIEQILGLDAASHAAKNAEYEWHQDPHRDPFAEQWSLVGS